MRNPKDRDRLVVRRLLLLALVAAFVGLGTAYKEPGGDSEEPVHLKIHDEDTVAFMHLNNQFAPVDRHPENYRTGLLFQLGGYAGGSGVAFAVSQINLHKSDGNVDSLEVDNERFWWVNIVSEHSIQEPPIKLADAFRLFFNFNTFSSSCDTHFVVPPGKLKWCQTTGAECSNAQSLDPSCLRHRQLHKKLASMSMITYWQGTHGYSMAAVQNPENFLHNRYDFSFKDTFRVDVYRAEEESATPHPPSSWKPLQSYAAGAIARIEIHGKITDPTLNHYNHDDPPWP